MIVKETLLERLCSPNPRVNIFEVRMKIGPLPRKNIPTPYKQHLRRQSAPAYSRVAPAHVVAVKPTQ